MDMAPSTLVLGVLPVRCAPCDMMCEVVRVSMAVVTVGQEGDVAPNSALRVVVDGTPIAIFNVHGELYAIGDTCTHEDYSLSDGELVDQYTVECPLHGAQFDLRTGVALCLPATGTAGSYPVWVEDGDLKLEITD